MRIIVWLLSVPCESGWFGVECNKQCHCRSGASYCRTDDGRCTDGVCSYGWTGSPYCQTGNLRILFHQHARGRSRIIERSEAGGGVQNFYTWSIASPMTCWCRPDQIIRTIIFITWCVNKDQILPKTERLTCSVRCSQISHKTELLHRLAAVQFYSKLLPFTAQKNAKMSSLKVCRKQPSWNKLVHSTLCLKKTSPFLFLWYLCQIASDCANYWKKHAPGNLKQTHVHAQFISRFICSYCTL